MSAADTNLTMDQGADWIVAFIYKDSAGNPINLTGYVAGMQLRAYYEDSSAVLTLTTISGITIDPLLGKITVHATATQTRNITAGDYVYDMQITSLAGIATRLVQGRVTVTPQVTR